MTERAIPKDLANTLVDPAAYADGRIYDCHAWLRRHAPLAWAEPDGFDPFWVVTRHADILDVSRRNSEFGNEPRAVTLIDKKSDELVRRLTGGSPNLVRMLIHMDGPDHLKYRALTQAWFMPPTLRRIEEQIRAMAERAVDKMAALGGECDFANDIAMGYSLHVIMAILGVPEEDEPRMMALTQELFGRNDPEKSRQSGPFDPEKFVAAIQSIVDDFNAYFAVISADRRARPRDDLASVIAKAVVDGAPISDLEAMSYYLIVATAGHDTTSASTSGGVWGLAQHPDQLRRVKEDPALVPGLVDEAIRWTTPVKTFMRAAMSDVELSGVGIARGDWLMLCYASGNRDEDIFDDPRAFRLDRKPNRHLSFGYGAHLCLGQHLAKMEMRLLFEALLPRLDHLELAGEPRITKGTGVAAISALPIRYEMT